MSLLDLLGTGKSIQQAQDAAQTIIQQIRPIADEIENRLEGIIRSNLDGAYITFQDGKIILRLPEVPKATAVNPAPD